MTVGEDGLTKVAAKLEAAERMRKALDSPWLPVLFACDGMQPTWQRELEAEINAAIAAYDAVNLADT